MAHLLWRQTLRDKLERLRAETEQIARHVEESDPQLAMQAVTMADRSISGIRFALEGDGKNLGAGQHDTAEGGEVRCPGCNRLYRFWWDGQAWTFQLLEA